MSSNYKMNERGYCKYKADCQISFGAGNECKAILRLTKVYSALGFFLIKK